MDKGIKKYDPHAIADAKMNAMINHKEAKRMLKKLTRMLDKKIASRYLHYRFLTNEKHAVKDAEAKAKIDPEVQEIEIQIDEAEERIRQGMTALERLEERPKPKPSLTKRITKSIRGFISRLFR